MVLQARRYAESARSNVPEAGQQRQHVDGILSQTVCRAAAELLGQLCPSGAQSTPKLRDGFPGQGGELRESNAAGLLSTGEPLHNQFRRRLYRLAVA